MITEWSGFVSLHLRHRMTLGGTGFMKQLTFNRTPQPIRECQASSSSRLSGAAFFFLAQQGPDPYLEVAGPALLLLHAHLPGLLGL